jgi:hypothetical protein
MPAPQDIIKGMQAGEETEDDLSSALAFFPSEKTAALAAPQSVALTAPRQPAGTAPVPGALPLNPSQELLVARVAAAERVCETLTTVAPRLAATSSGLAILRHDVHAYMMKTNGRCNRLTAWMVALAVCALLSLAATAGLAYLTLADEPQIMIIGKP